MTTTLTIHTDGGARGNPGPAAIGVVIEEEKTENGKRKTEKIAEFGKTIGETTNNVAEYTAVIEALKYILYEWVAQVRGSPSSARNPAHCQEDPSNKNDRCLCGQKTSTDSTKVRGMRTSDGEKPVTGPMEIHLLLDSLLIVNQLNGVYKIKDAKLRELSLKVRGLEQDLPAGGQGLGVNITYSYVSREQNKEADRMVNQALDKLENRT